MNIIFRLSLLRSSFIYYFTLINDDVKKKKNIKAEEDCQHILSSIKKKIEKNTLIFNDKITALSMSNNSRKLEKKVQKAQRIAYHY